MVNWSKSWGSVEEQVFLHAPVGGASGQPEGRKPSAGRGLSAPVSIQSADVKAKAWDI